MNIKNRLLYFECTTRAEEDLREGYATVSTAAHLLTMLSKVVFASVLLIDWSKSLMSKVFTSKIDILSR